MSKRPVAAAGYVQPYRYASPDIPLSAIKRFARRIAAKFHPDKILLFGSYAYGTPHAESDVDLLVIMPCRNAIDQSIRIGLAFERPFSFDLIVRTPYQVKPGLKEGDWDWFLREIMEKGKVLYEAPNRPVSPQSRGRLGHGEKDRPAQRASPCGTVYSDGGSFSLLGSTKHDSDR
jgi:predicted nucleotidyltransferase